MHQEVSELPVQQRRAVIRDCLLDLLSVDEQIDSIASVQDATRVVTSIVEKNVIITPALEKTGFIKELSSMIELIISSRSITETERLVNALARERVDPNVATTQNVVVTGNKVVVRIPSYDTSNTGQMDNLGKYLRWAVTVLGIKDPVVRILPDEKLGNAIILPAKLERMMDMSIAAMSLPPRESGDRAEFKTGLKANLVELIAAVRIMRRYQGSLQKLPAPKGKKALSTTLDDLRSSINGRIGLNEHGLPAFVAIFVKSILNELTKPNNSRFPGKWIASLKESNGVKSNTGLLYKMGYEGCVANPQKTIAVVKNTIGLKASTQADSDKKSKKDNKPSKDRYKVITTSSETHPDGINHREFRLGAFLLLPLIDPKAKDSPKDQLSIDVIGVKDRKITSFYKENRDVVDAMNLAYATLKAIGKKDSKATPLGYQSARGHAISLTANREWMDASGTKYSAFKELPEHTREFLLRFLNRKIKEEDSDSESEDEYETASPKDKGSSLKKG